jgi:hypothetical protein
MDPELLALIREVSELPTSDETPGLAALDFELDNMILTARSIVRRERCCTASNDDAPCETYSKTWL